MGKWLAIVVALLGLALGHGALAETVDLDGDSLSLPVPEGFCSLSPRLKADAALLEQLRRMRPADKNRMLLIAVPCRDLLQVRERTLQTFPWFMWLSLDKDGKSRRLPASVSRHQVLDLIEAEMTKKDVHPLDQEARQRMAQQGIRTQTRTSLMVARDDAAAYSTILFDATVAGRAERGLILVGTTVLRSRPLNAHLYTPHKGTAPHDAALGVMKAVMAEGVRLNDRPAAP